MDRRTRTLFGIDVRATAMSDPGLARRAALFEQAASGRQLQDRLLGAHAALREARRRASELPGAVEIAADLLTALDAVAAAQGKAVQLVERLQAEMRSEDQGRPGGE